MAAAYRITFFNEHMAAARRALNERNGFRSEMARQDCADGALAHLGHALRLANQLQDDTRKAMCLRVMNWLRADLRRAA